MNTAGFVFGAIISTIIMFGTVMAAHANAVCSCQSQAPGFCDFAANHLPRSYVAQLSALFRTQPSGHKLSAIFADDNGVGLLTWVQGLALPPAQAGFRGEISVVPAESD